MDKTFFHYGAPTYYWCPTCPGCTLKNDQDYATITARLTPIEQKETYPDYKRLIDDKGEIHVYAIYPKTSSSFCKTNDWAYHSYRRLYDRALADGFYLSREAPPAATKGLCEAYVLEKKVTKAKVVLHLFYGSARPWFDQAVETGSVVLYNGHSELGRAFNGVKFGAAKDRYQIYVLNACNSYSHYVQNMFKARSSKDDPTGTQNLEVIANADEAMSMPQNEEEVRVYRAVLEWADEKSTASYAEILKAFPSVQFPGVVGEEDNPKTPEEP